MNGTDSQDGFDNFIELAQLGTQTFLANQAISSPRPSTYSVNSQGQMIATGGGAPAATLLSGGGGGLLWVIVLVAIVFLFSRRR